MAFVRLVVFGFVGLSIVFGLVWLYLRSLRRERLEKEWAQEHGTGGDNQARDAYIDPRMRVFESRLMPVLILLVYVVPALIVAGIHIMTTVY